MEVVKIYILGNILKQRLRTDPADSGRNASESVHSVEGLSSARRDAEPDVWVAIAPVRRQPTFDKFGPLRQYEPNNVRGIIDN